MLTGLAVFLAIIYKRILLQQLSVIVYATHSKDALG